MQYASQKKSGNIQSALIEFIAIISVGLLGLILILSKSDEEVLHSALFTQQPAIISIQTETQNYSIKLFDEQWLLCDEQGVAFARLADSSILDSLWDSNCVRSFQSEDWSNEKKTAYRSEHVIHLSSDGNTALSLSTGADGQGYAWRDGKCYQLDHNPAPLFNRPLESLRSSSLDLGDAVPEIHLSKREIHFEQERYWMRHNNLRYWMHQELLQDWLDMLSHVRADSFPAYAGGAALKEFTFVYENYRVIIQDLGPFNNKATQENSRLLKRIQIGESYKIEELMTMPLEKDTLHLSAANLVPEQLCPIPLEQIHKISFGEVQLAKNVDGWQVNERDDSDHMLIQKWLSDLSTIPGNREFVADAERESPVITVSTPTASWSLPPEALTKSPRLQKLLLFRSQDFLSRNLCVNVALSDVDALVIAARDKAPRVYERLNENSWDFENSEALDEFVTSLLLARVTHWLEKKPPTNWDSTITLNISANNNLDANNSDKNRSCTIQLHESGLVHLPERGLTGMLDKASKEELLAE